MDVEGPGNNRPGPGGAPGGFPSGLSGSIPEYPSSTNYTIPGILHFIKHEWSRFEKERSSWEVQKTELQRKIALLQGERKGHENLMHDLIRRIKMLEFALKQERAKLYKAVHGKELVFADMKPPSEPENNRPQLDVTTVATQREESRKILRDYLREVGFPDNVLEARVARMTAYKNLYGQTQMMEQPPGSLNSRNESPPPQSNVSSFPSSTPPPPPSTSVPLHLPALPNGPVANGTDMQVQGGSPKGDLTQPRPLDLREKESEGEDVNAVFQEFDFLEAEYGEEDDDDDEDEDVEMVGGENPGSTGWVPNSSTGRLPFEMESGGDDIEDEMNTESALDEFTQDPSELLMGGAGAGTEDRHQEEASEFSEQVKKYAENKRKKKKTTDRPNRKMMQEYKKQTEGQANSSSTDPQMSTTTGPSSMGMMQLPGKRRPGSYPLDLVPGGMSESTYEANLLGELAVISIEQETTIPESARKWEHKYTLQSHFDCVTSVVFHPTEQLVLTSSEDCTLKLWNLQRARQKSKDSRKSMLVDVEALHTFRGHRGAVLSVAYGLGGEVCYSGSADSTIRVWRMPEEVSDDPFSVYDADVHQGVLTGHTNAVWGLAVHTSTGLLLSCSADATCRLWNHHQTSPQVMEFTTEQRFGSPTSVDFVWTNSHQMAASYQASKIVIYDLETGQSVVNLDSGSTYDGTPKTQINQVVCHPTIPLVVSAHEDKYIKFYDANSGKMIDYTTGHTDSVSSLAIDQLGQYLISGGHDGSLRFWSLDTKTLIHEIGAVHRKHFDESIYGVTCHASEPFFASAGADGIAKVYV